MRSATASFELSRAMGKGGDVSLGDSFNFTAAINAANHPTARWTVNPTFAIDTTASVVTNSLICQSTVRVSAIGNFNRPAGMQQAVVSVMENEERPTELEADGDPSIRLNPNAVSPGRFINYAASDVSLGDSFNFTAAINAANHPTARWTVNPTFAIDTTASVVTNSLICQSTVRVSAIGNFNRPAGMQQAVVSVMENEERPTELEADGDPSIRLNPNAVSPGRFINYAASE
nr:unnamed protein product [Spirometra erinaceieuropaei]